MENSGIVKISREELLPLAEKMSNEKRRLIIMNGYIDKDGNNVVVYNFDVDGQIITYECRGCSTLPTVTHIFKGAAQWCEEEISEMMPIEFEGLDKSGRLFLPEEFDGTGQILVMPIDDLKKINENKGRDYSNQ
ncbi:respiratory-chain NADH dehydrogenase, 30 Kd subunit [Clostridium tepidiprofundi DSM 19306]|uniref:Respiratory-chain NADH dehydrogenase, 30 Kd subunit n=1 Tax=Clostridium tepidiprofundi DSM 19306 TaxID=1121338 RepID=A0A151B761_9CLOT|nr:NADH-quinone oxidoreductase subunit C [Clostridium tepidiprofundi]KYH35630.1 respiratory-chain NADH dehydrogenase, 30 Kd subunit [Clostridium tepidiprofundi DSM 19306]